MRRSGKVQRRWKREGKRARRRRRKRMRVVVVAVVVEAVVGEVLLRAGDVVVLGGFSGGELCFGGMADGGGAGSNVMGLLVFVENRAHGRFAIGGVFQPLLFWSLMCRKKVIRTCTV